MVLERDGRPAEGVWSGAAPTIGVAVLLVVDVVVGQRYYGLNPAALVAGGAVGLCLLLASSRLFAATLVATGASLLISLLVHRAGADLSQQDLLGRNAWPGLAEGGGLLFLACWSLRSLVRSHALTTTGAVVAAGLAIISVRSDAGHTPLMTLVSGLGLAVAAGVGLYLRWIDLDRRRNLQRVRQDERLAIARELHDVVAHYVTGIVVQAQAAQEVWPARPDVAHDALGQIEVAGSEALASMRRLVGTLRNGADGPLVPAATIEDLRTLAARSTAVGLPVRLLLDGFEELPLEVGPSVHRVVGEAVANAQRHAIGATAVEVEVRLVDGALLVQVSDDGHAATPGRSSSAGYGLTGMAERTEALGGRFDAGPRDGGGWRVRALIPLGQAT